MSQQTTLQMSHSPNKSQYYDISRNGNRYGGQAAAAGAGAERGERVERGAPPPAPVAADHHR